MRLLWFILLLGFGVQVVSDFPVLSTDTVGALPPTQRSPRLLRLFREANRSTQLHIRFTQLPIGVRNTSAVETTAEEEIVALRQDLNHEQEENSIAHELFHIILRRRGFSGVVQVPNNAPRLMKELAFTITSCVDDVLIDDKMSKLGFEPEVLNRDSLDRLRYAPPRIPPGMLNDAVMLDGNAFLIICSSFRKRYPGDDIEPIWQKLDAGVVARARVLTPQIGDIRCDSAQSCLEKKKRIRDILGYPITFLNPLTGRFE